MNRAILEIKKVQENMQEIGKSMGESNFALAKTLTDMMVSIGSLAGGVGYNSSKIGALKGEFKQHKEWNKWALGGDKSLPRRQRQLSSPCMKLWSLLSTRTMTSWTSKWELSSIQ